MKFPRIVPALVTTAGKLSIYDSCPSSFVGEYNLPINDLPA
jgi:hypothetical protein